MNACTALNNVLKRIEWGLDNTMQLIFSTLLEITQAYPKSLLAQFPICPHSFHNLPPVSFQISSVGFSFFFPSGSSHLAVVATVIFVAQCMFKFALGFLSTGG